MKKHTFVFSCYILFVSLLFVACKKKLKTVQQQYTCGKSYYYIPVTPVFKGFSVEELKMVILNKYVPNNQFDSLKSTDTLDLSNSIFVGDTAYAANSSQWVRHGAFEIKVGDDYTIVIPTINKVFSITNVHEGPKVVTWLQSTPCSTSPGSLQPAFTHLLLDLNNESANIYYLATNNYLVCLQH